MHGRTAAQAYTGAADWDLIARVAASVTIPVFGNGDLVEPAELVGRMRARGVAGVLVGRGVVRNPWLLAQAADLAAGSAARATVDGRARPVPPRLHRPAARGAGAPGAAPGRRRQPSRPAPAAIGHERWVINKLRALVTWFSKGIEGGPRLRVAVNVAETVAELREVIERHFAGDS